MELFVVEGNHYIALCPTCSEVIKLKINYDNFCISVKCPKGHNNQNISHKIFEENYIKPIQTYLYSCYRCNRKINNTEMNYKCGICNQLFCQKCINKHIAELKHNTKNIFMPKEQLCLIHNKKYTLFCQTCKINVCENCINLHKEHNTKSFFDVIP